MNDMTNLLSIIMKKLVEKKVDVQPVMPKRKEPKNKLDKGKK